MSVSCGLIQISAGEVSMEPYTPEVQEVMRRFYQNLNERDRRRYAGVEALKYGHGGRIYIARILGCSRNTVSQGAREVSGLATREVEERIRKPGGGRKSYEETWGPELDEKFLAVLGEHTAGDPMDGQVRWTNLTQGEIAQALVKEYGIRVSRHVVRKLLRKHHYRRRKAQKKKCMKTVIQNRNEQFENIARLKAEFAAAGNPIISLDTKKKEYLGNFYRPGKLYTREVLPTYDHDFYSYAEGVVIPHGIYDLQRNEGYLQLGTSHDTSEFACASLRYWWFAHGRHHYSQSAEWLVLCDGGGSNSSRHYLFKQDLQALADELGITIRIAHYPPYCSKYNPIEHRFFPHVTRACQGVIFTSLKLVKELMEKARTSTGLRTFVHIIDVVYATGRKVAEDFKENMRIMFDDYLPQWNYCAVPLAPQNAQVV
jgi:hypothetical protein